MKTEEPINETKLSAKTTALKMAREINPNSNPRHVAGTVAYNQPEVPPTAEKLIKDAQTIFDWLTA